MTVVRKEVVRKEVVRKEVVRKESTWVGMEMHGRVGCSGALRG
jgi:hypothetical protein